LELARLYAYLYQNTDKQYGIVHALDGYDEISHTGDFKIISNSGENYYTVDELGFEPLAATQLAGGDNVEEATKIFRNIIEGKGIHAENKAVVNNAEFAIITVRPRKSFGGCYY